MNACNSDTDKTGGLLRLAKTAMQMCLTRGVAAGKWGVTYAVLLILCASIASAQSISVSCNAQGAQAAFQQHDQYAALKDLEGCFQVPENSKTVVVGKFDPLTGAFTYASQIGQRQSSIPLDEVTVPAITGKGPTGGNVMKVVNVSHLVGVVPANAVNVSLTFQSANGTAIPVVVKQLEYLSWGLAQVTCGTINAGCPWPKTVVSGDWRSAGPAATVNVGKASAVAFTVGSRGKSFTGYLLIDRPLVMALGAFTVPAIPLAIIYAPPLGQQKTNNSGYSNSTVAGTVLSMSVAQDNSTTQPTGDFSNSMTDVTNMASVVSKVPVISGYAKPYSDAIGLVNQFIGTMSQTTTQGTTLTENHTLGVAYQAGATWTTGDRAGGPGLEDEFLFLRNAKLMWTTWNGRLSVHLFKATFDMKAAHYLLENKDNPKGYDCVADHDSPNGYNCLDSQTIKGLLALDPFTAPYVNAPFSTSMESSNGIIPGWMLHATYAPGAAPTNSSGLVPPSPQIPARWRDLGTDDMSDSDQNPYNPLNSYTLSQSDTYTSGNYTTTVLDAKAGLIAGLNPDGPDNSQNVTQTATNKTTVTFTQATGDTASQTWTTSAKFYFAQNETLTVEAYYDVVLGTFAFVPQPSIPQAAYSGVMSSANGLPLANQLVVLKIGTKRYMTKTDAKGRYAFHSAGITPGAAASVTVGNVTRPIQIPLGRAGLSGSTPGIAPPTSATVHQ